MSLSTLPADAFLYEYAVIRYVPRVDREEFVNIGIIMMNKRMKWLKAEVQIDEKRIQALYPKSDISCLQSQSRIFLSKDAPKADLPVEEKYRWLTAVKSACLQVSPSHPALIQLEEGVKREDIDIIMDKEFRRLFRLLVE